MESEQLTNDELSEFREIFNLVDRDNGGTITKEELAELLETLGIETSSDELGIMINEIDQDNNGEIDFDEFVAVMSRRGTNAPYTCSEVKHAFKIFEGEGGTRGFIHVDILINALSTYGADKLNVEEARYLVSQLEKDSFGYINYTEYVNMMLSAPVKPPGVKLPAVKPLVLNTPLVNE